ncbi:Tat binding protein 1-interacting [Scheffersomyces coipomensis]|uniref:Tat binding protein 1-interacting n=1 Tax=Scheffersomyces coipomensis TaxID=1788519 RepID=UPI00315D067A
MSSKKGNKSIVEAVEAETMVRDYLRDQYRPYSITDLVLNLHNQITRSDMSIILQTLIESGDIISKTFGKFTFYLYKEREGEEVEIDSNQLIKLSTDVNMINSQLNQVKQDYQRLLQAPNEQTLKQEIRNKQLSIRELESKIVHYQSHLSKQKTTSTSSSLEMIKSHYNKLITINNDRKKIVCIVIYSKLYHIRTLY